MRIAPCTRAHAPEILAIFNDAIVNSTALYDYVPRPPEAMQTWFDVKERGRFPVIGAFAEDGTLAGFASYGTFRAWPAYKYSVEHSVYIRTDQRGRGLGKLLLNEIVAAAQTQGYHTVIGGIDSTNAASIRLHEAAGFMLCGTVKHAGFKFGRWLDLVFYQKLLPTPVEPRDG